MIFPTGCSAQVGVYPPFGIYLPCFGVDLCEEMPRPCYQIY